MPRVVLLFLFLLVASRAATAGNLGYAVASQSTPVLNTPDFRAVFGGRDGSSLATDRCGQLRALEFVALTGTVFTVAAELAGEGASVLRVTTAEYPYPTTTGYYVDSRLVRRLAEPPAGRPRRLPARAEIIDRLLAMTGFPYVWGGNVPAGLPHLLALYPPARPLAAASRERWQLAGVDCSGLLYAATDGYTPRNTCALVGYGTPVAVAGRSAAAIVGLLKPLDLLVWSGHVMIVLDRERVIESRLDCAYPERGVVVRPLGEALAGIMARRRLVDRPSAASGKGGQEFVVRRWYP